MIFNHDVNPVSVDLETLGLAPNAAIIQIGAVQFNRAGGVLSQFHIHINPAGQAAPDPDTIKWWLDQGESGVETLRKAYSSSVSIEEGLQLFKDWFGSLNTNGSGWRSSPEFDGPVLFRGNKDMSWLENAYDKDQSTLPFHFQEVHEQRQFLRAAEYMGFDHSEIQWPEGLVPHNALDDAIWQATCACLSVAYLDEVKANIRK